MKRTTVITDMLDRLQFLLYLLLRCQFSFYLALFLFFLTLNHLEDILKNKKLVRKGFREQTSHVFPPTCHIATLPIHPL